MPILPTCWLVKASNQWTFLIGAMNWVMLLTLLKDLPVAILKPRIIITSQAFISLSPLVAERVEAVAVVVMVVLKFSN